MNDVARMAGVNVGTVSRALAGSPSVLPETRDRIKEAVRLTGYVINHAARSLRENRSNQVLISLPNIANPFFSEVVAAVEGVAREAGYAVLINNNADRADADTWVTQSVLTGAVDGLLLQTGSIPEGLIEYPDLPRRTVAVALPIPHSGLTSVAINEVAAAREAVEYLISIGHRRIAHIAGPPAITNRDRLEGYRSALSSARIEADDSLHIAGDNSIASGRSAARKILEHPMRPTAIFCANDEMAIGAIVACRELGLGVPDEVSIVGFDDIEMATYYHPPLTTVRQPRKDIGEKAMSELLAQLDGSRKRLGRRIVLEHSLIVRQSTSARPN